MEKNLQNILLIVFIVLLLAGGVFIFFQQRDINKLKNQGFGVNAFNLQDSGAASEAKIPSYRVAATEKTISESVKDISGKITAVSGKTLTIEADIVDFSKLADLPEVDLAKPIDTLPQTKKSFQVSTDDKTQFAGKAMEMISVGDTVKIFANELVYETNNLTAAKIVSSEAAKASGIEIKTVGGKIKEIGDKFLVIESKIVDYSKVADIKSLDLKSIPFIIDKTYKVFINDKTEFSDKKLKELKPGDGGIFSSATPLANVTEFTAIKIVSPVPAPPKR